MEREERYRQRREQEERDKSDSRLRQQEKEDERERDRQRHEEERQISLREEREREERYRAEIEEDRRKERQMHEREEREREHRKHEEQRKRERDERDIVYEERKNQRHEKITASSKKRASKLKVQQEDLAALDHYSSELNSQKVEIDKLRISKKDQNEKMANLEYSLEMVKDSNYNYKSRVREYELEHETLDRDKHELGSHINMLKSDLNELDYHLADAKIEKERQEKMATEQASSNKKEATNVYRGRQDVIDEKVERVDFLDDFSKKIENLCKRIPPKNKPINIIDIKKSRIEGMNSNLSPSKNLKDIGQGNSNQNTRGQYDQNLGIMGGSLLRGKEFIEAYQSKVHELQHGDFRPFRYNQMLPQTSQTSYTEKYKMQVGIYNIAGNHANLATNQSAYYNEPTEGGSTTEAFGQNFEKTENNQMFLTSEGNGFTQYDKELNTRYNFTGSNTSGFGKGNFAGQYPNLTNGFKSDYFSENGNKFIGGLMDMDKSRYGCNGQLGKTMGDYNFGRESEIGDDSPMGTGMKRNPFDEKINEKDLQQKIKTRPIITHYH